MLEAGTKAPVFTLSDKDGCSISLSDFLGKKVVLYFYSKDNTSGCTRQACAFAAAYGMYEKLGVKVIGISRDSEESHRKFSEKNALPFILLSDPDRCVAKMYDVLTEKKSAGKVTVGTSRTTYLIDESGVIENVWKKANPDTNAAEILTYLTDNK